MKAVKMSIIVEFLVKERVGTYHAGQIAQLDEDDSFLRPLVLSGYVDILNPPDWTVEAYDAKKAGDFLAPKPSIQEPVAVEPVVQEPVIQEVVAPEPVIQEPVLQETVPRYKRTVNAAEVYSRNI